MDSECDFKLIVEDAKLFELLMDTAKKNGIYENTARIAHNRIVENHLIETWKTMEPSELFLINGLGKKAVELILLARGDDIHSIEEKDYSVPDILYDSKTNFEPKSYPTEESFEKLYDALLDCSKRNGLLWRWGERPVYLAHNRWQFETLRELAMLGSTNEFDRIHNSANAYPKVLGEYKGPGWYAFNRVEDSYERGKTVAIKSELLAPKFSQIV